MSSAKIRKQYVIKYRGDDFTHRNTLKHSGLPVGLEKFIDTISGEDLRVLLSPKDAAERDPIPAMDYALITRRAAARKIVAYLIAARLHGHAAYQLLEVGEFKRDVRPVKHWNIERTHAKIDDNGKRVAPWSKPLTWVTGIELREEARANAREMTEEYAKDEGVFGERMRFRVVPVYAD